MNGSPAPSTAAAPAAIFNAVNDALAPLGAHIAETPITPARVLAAIADLDPSMTVLDDVRRPLRDTADVAELASTMPGSAPSGVDRDDPAVVAAMDEAIRRYEAAWLDEPIPALDGYPPRQAADDPTRRGDLIALLDTFPVLEGAVGMDAERLRAALGLA